MSRWTYVCGSLGFSKDPYEFKLDEEGCIQYQKGGRYEGFAIKHLPYPNEQVKLGKIEPMHTTVKDRGENTILDGFRIDLEVSSFPIIKRDIKLLMQDLPEGEYDCVNYLLQESRSGHSSSSCFETPQSEKLFRKLVGEQFPKYKDNWKFYNSLTPIELGWENETESAIVSIHDSIRHCDSTTFLSKLMEFLTKLVDMGYDFDQGVFNIDDCSINITVHINWKDVEITIVDNTTKEITKEYYHGVEDEDLSTDERVFPYKMHLVKVDALE